MTRSEVSHDIGHLAFEEDYNSVGVPPSGYRRGVNKDDQGHSPHPSLGSFGSEEVRCSLDELDAVIATYDDYDDSRRHLLTFPSTVTTSREYTNCSTFIHSSSATAASVSSSLLFSNRLSTLHTNDELSSFISQPSQSTATTIGATKIIHLESSSTNNNNNDNSRSFDRVYEMRKLPTDQIHVNNAPIELNSSLPSSCTLTKYSNKTDSSPPLPPPPDLCASENFPLPPPPPLPPSSSSSNCSPSFTPAAQLKFPFNGHSDIQVSNARHELEASIDSSFTSRRYSQPPNISAPKSSSSSSRPLIPQRAPSTRLTSVSNWSKQDSDTPIVETVKYPNASFGNNEASNLKTEYCKSDVFTSMESSVKAEENDSIERTTLPVQDIIRKFGNLLVSNAKVSNQCNTSTYSPHTISSTIRPCSTNDYLHNTPSNHIPQTDKTAKPSIIHKYSQPAFHVNSHYSSSSTPSIDNATPIVLASQNYSIQESTQTHTSSMIHSNQNSNFSPEANRFGQMNNPSPLFTFSPSLPSNPMCTNRKIGNDIAYSTSSTCSFVSQTSLSPVNNTSTFLTSGNMSNGLSKTHVSANTTTTTTTNYNNNNNNAHSTNGGKDSTHSQIHRHQQQQLDSHVVHQLSGTLLQRRLSSDSSSDTSMIHVQSMNLDSNTLAVFNQFNIDWKTHRLERKNRDAANVYAEELKKWGLIPSWKRELIEKKQLNKMDNHHTSSNHHYQYMDSQGSSSVNQSLATAELAEKLQRRLDKVSQGTIES
ncbi:unnamed protein product [Heterobilharzia americana]|nr:unnamed protein product [Heterobilharzia americana]